MGRFPSDTAVWTNVIIVVLDVRESRVEIWQCVPWVSDEIGSKGLPEPLVFAEGSRFLGFTVLLRDSMK